MLRLLTMLLFMLSLPTAYAAEVCGSEIKNEVAHALSQISAAPQEEQLALQAELYEKYKYCLDKIPQANAFRVAARRCGARVSHLGRLYFEEMSCCGYDPQRRQFACPIRIKQRFGFGGAPLPGSREYVLHCVRDPNTNTWLPVGRDSVHLANEMFGINPSWQFAVIANANENLHTIYPMSGETRRARSILSWGFEPTSCNFQPIWGNAINYNIRLDQ